MYYYQLQLSERKSIAGAGYYARCWKKKKENKF